MHKLTVASTRWAPAAVHADHLQNCRGTGGRIEKCAAPRDTHTSLITARRSSRQEITERRNCAWQVTRSIKSRQLCDPGRRTEPKPRQGTCARDARPSSHQHRQPSLVLHMSAKHRLWLPRLVVWGGNSMANDCKFSIQYSGFTWPRTSRRRRCTPFCPRHWTRATSRRGSMKPHARCCCAHSRLYCDEEEF